MATPDDYRRMEDFFAERLEVREGHTYSDSEFPDCKLNVLMPVYNEACNLPHCLESLLAQTLMPSKIILVDDGSTDESMKVVKSFLERATIISLSKPHTERTALGFSTRYAWVVSEGSKYLDDDFDFVAILDADTVLEPRYYEKVISRLLSNPSIGIAGGSLLNDVDPGLILGMLPFVFGCNRVFTRECWLAVNKGPVMTVICKPDTYQHLTARMLGYSPTRFDHIKSWALRPATIEKFSTGYYSWMLGYYPWFLMLRALRNRSPRMIAGYLKAFLKKEKQSDIKPLIRQVQMERMKKLLRINRRPLDLRVARKAERELHEREW